ncbi:MAG TPA: alpha/beta hydrolase domain-containing protein [Mycobacteriales bacterium]|nr:alpha/beta hydrolase domain-containing protein [Mycobacteriales bacterium]
MTSKPTSDRARRVAVGLTAAVAMCLSAPTVFGASAAAAASPALNGPAATRGPLAVSDKREPNPTVTGPLTGGVHGHPFMATAFKVSDYGYTQREFMFSGVATAYAGHQPPASYATRMLIYAPKNPKRFSGTVIVEWDNVTAQLDAPADFEWTYPQVMADGDAYVEVTAQQVGVCGLGLTGDPIAGKVAVCTPTSLKGFDPVRYAALHLPGDAYSFDIFSQALQAVKHPRGINPLGRLHPRVVLAAGESQAAFELDDYIQNGADSDARLADGFLVDSDLNHPEPHSYRVPTLFIWGEDSVQKVTKTFGRNHVAWSVSGAGHTDYWLLQHLVPAVAGTELNTPPVSKPREQALELTDGDYGQAGGVLSDTCAGGEQYPRRYVLDAAINDLARWAGTGKRAPTVPPLKFSSRGLPPSSLFNLGVVFTTDPQGNALGGLREPLITHPVATYIGNACPLLGTSTPLTHHQLVALYPTHAAYVRKMITATSASVLRRFMTQRDGRDLIARACRSAIPGWGTTATSSQPPICRALPRDVR